MRVAKFSIHVMNTAQWRISFVTKAFSINDNMCSLIAGENLPSNVAVSATAKTLSQ